MLFASRPPPARPRCARARGGARRAAGVATSARRREAAGNARLERGVAVGSAQAAALFPGISRCGVTMGGGLIVGLTNEDAARYAFLLATPIIAAAALLKIPRPPRSRRRRRPRPGPRRRSLRGRLRLASVRFLMRYFETNRLTPFRVYCVLFGSRLPPRLRPLSIQSTAFSTRWKKGCGNVENRKIRKLRPLQFSTP